MASMDELISCVSGRARTALAPVLLSLQASAHTDKHGGLNRLWGLVVAQAVGVSNFRADRVRKAHSLLQARSHG